MSAGNFVRVAAILAAVVAAAGSATSSSNDKQSFQQQANAQQQTPPPPQQMEPARALGLWRSTFGAVKIEADGSKGGLTTGAVQGVWVYQRQGQEVVGYFAGNLRGNVLDFTWQEPNNPPLTGAGYLVFDPQGRQYSGRWWSDRKDRIGDWNGWRQAASANASDQYQPQQPPQRPAPSGWGAPQPAYGGQTYGANPYGPNGGQYGGAAYGYQQPQQPSYPPQRPQQPPQPYYPQRPPQQYPQQRPQQPPQPYYPQQPRQPQPQPYYPQQPPPPQQPQPSPYY
jgi:hypothetical protein